MNIVLLLTPKIELEYVYEYNTVRQIMEKMNRYRYSVSSFKEKWGVFNNYFRR